MKIEIGSYIQIENALTNVEIACLQPDIIFKGKKSHRRIISPISCSVLTKKFLF